MPHHLMPSIAFVSSTRENVVWTAHRNPMVRIALRELQLMRRLDIVHEASRTEAISGVIGTFQKDLT
jgi:hypothetical protein